jgi:hypothetical protein
VAFVDSERQGRWAQPEAVPGLATLSDIQGSGIGQVSCSALGNCSAGGSYTTDDNSKNAFVVSESGGHWGQAQLVPGLAAVTVDLFYAQVSAISCPAAGACLAGGSWEDQDGSQYPFLVSETRGQWGQVQAVPGLTAAGQGNQGLLDTISCGARGYCTAGGIAGSNNGYDYNGGGQAYVVSEQAGIWGKTVVIPGLVKLNSGVDGGTTALSCTGPGDCAATGYYGVGSAGNKVYDLEVFVATQTNGTWGKAEQIPGTARLNTDHWAFNGGLSCATPGHCATGGSYVSKAKAGIYFDSEAFITSQGGA